MWKDSDGASLLSHTNFAFVNLNTATPFPFPFPPLILYLSSHLNLRDSERRHLVENTASSLGLTTVLDALIGSAESGM